ncbi:lectin BRA-3-like [Stigmatopora nigra]
MAFAPRVLLLLCGISGLFSAVHGVLDTVPVPCCPDGWVRWRNTCYIFQSTQLNYTDAAVACNGMMGAYLAPIHDSVENALAEELIRQQFSGQIRDTWIGRNDGLTEGDFVLINGDKSKFENFRTNQPDNFQDEDCAEIDNEGDWNDDDCADLNYYLCAKPLW